MKYFTFIQTLPEKVIPHLPESLQSVKPHQPFRWVVQFHFGERRLHYEVGRISGSQELEIGLHCEAKDKQLNRFLLYGFRRHLFEIKAQLGDGIEAEMWDRGWTKIYERFPAGTLDEAYQEQVGRRLAEIITCLHPIFVDLRREVMRVHR